MRHLDILLPFALPPTEMANDLLPQMQTPSLALLLGRAGHATEIHSEPYARSLPHEQWLARRHRLHGAADSSPALATAFMQHSFGQQPEEGTWFILQPAHLHVARDHLVLTDLRQLELDESESQALFDAAQPLFEESGFSLLYGDAHHWFVRADAWSDLKTATPDAASGHNIDIWLPKGSQERAWRRLHNEVQMTWHAHPVNMERDARRANPVNALWLWGGAAAASDMQQGPVTLSLPEARHAFARAGQAIPETGGIEALLDADMPQAVVVLDTLIGPALVQDWSQWLQRFHELEEGSFAPLLAALKSGKIERVSLIATDSTAVSECTVSRSALRKFWARPSLTKLAR